MIGDSWYSRLLARPFHLPPPSRLTAAAYPPHPAPFGETQRRRTPSEQRQAAGRSYSHRSAVRPCCAQSTRPIPSALAHRWVPSASLLRVAECCKPWPHAPITLHAIKQQASKHRSRLQVGTTCLNLIQFIYLFMN